MSKLTVANGRAIFGSYKATCVFLRINNVLVPDICTFHWIPPIDQTPEILFGFLKFAFIVEDFHSRFDIMGLGLLLPIQAYIVRQYSQEAIMVAMIPVLYAAAQFFAAPLLGKLSDRFG